MDGVLDVQVSQSSQREYSDLDPNLKHVLVQDGVLLDGMLCDACKNIFQTGEYYSPVQISTLHATTSGCYLCRYLAANAHQLVRNNRKPDQPVQFRFEWDSSGDMRMGTTTSDSILHGIPMHPQKESSARCETCLFNHGTFSPAARLSLRRCQDLPMAWLNECLCGHENCRADEGPGFQPPRLISVSEKAIHLVDFAITGREIRSEQLPQTFRDAIAFTRALGILYIWIDALCIVQSGERSTEDWQNHLTLMASIYANGVVNLSASSSHDAHGGLGVPSGPYFHPPILSVRVENRHEKEQFMLVDPYDRTHTTDKNPIIDTRGWVAQERILSPRLIDFTAGKVYWQCVQGMASELCPYGRPYDYGDPFCSRTLVGGHGRQGVWPDILQDYTKRKLTNPSDKFPAIAGIASKFADFQKDKYFAGHFSSTLPENLLWCRFHGSVKRAEDAYVAPSWSWASMAGQVRVDDMYLKGERVVAVVKKIEVGLKDPKNRFGQITSGSIVLEGPLLENQQFDLFTKDSTEVPVWWQLAEGKIIPGPSVFRIALDVSRDTFDGRALSFFGITPTKGLVLVKLDRDTYERVGIFNDFYTTDLSGIVDKRPWRKRKIKIV